MKISVTRSLQMLVLAFVIGGCVTIPKEAPVLSMELGKRITSIEEANLTLLHRYFDFKRDQVQRFTYDVWLPIFARNVMEHETTKAEWKRVVQSGDSKMAFDFIMDVGPQLQSAINEKHEELAGPLNSLEREIELKIRAEYHQARSINNTLTSFLTSSAKVSEDRKRYLDMIGISDDKISKALDNTDETVAKLLNAGDSMDQVSNALPEYIQRLKNIKASISQSAVKQIGGQ